jgi:hypothetical protein
MIPTATAAPQTSLRLVRRRSFGLVSLDFVVGMVSGCPRRFAPNPYIPAGSAVESVGHTAGATVKQSAIAEPRCLTRDTRTRYVPRERRASRSVDSNPRRETDVPIEKRKDLPLLSEAGRSSKGRRNSILSATRSDQRTKDSQGATDVYHGVLDFHERISSEALLFGKSYSSLSRSSAMCSKPRRKKQSAGWPKPCSWCAVRGD